MLQLILGYTFATLTASAFTIFIICAALIVFFAWAAGV